MNIIEEVSVAVEYTKQKQYKKAEKIYKNLLVISDKNPLILSLLGVLYMYSGSLKKSEKVLENVYKMQKNLSAIESLAIVKFALGKTDEAEKYFSMVIDETKNFEVFDKYITILTDKKCYLKANQYAEKCYEKFPLKKESLKNLAYSCIGIGKLKDAYNYSSQLVKNFPTYGEGWSVFGLIIEMLYRDDDKAFVCYKNELKYGNKDSAYYNLAINCDKRKDYKKALYYINKLRKRNPNDVSTEFLLSGILFKQRKLKKAYGHYVNYVRELSLKEKQNPIKKLKNLWDGKIEKDKTIFVFSDQGAGDILMFLRYLKFLETKFKKIKVMVPESVLKIAKRAFENKKIKFYSMKSRFPKYDYSVVLSTLPYYLKMPLDNIPLSEGYLIADEEKIDKYKKIINTKKLKVGLVWEAGGTGWRELLNRTLNISVLAPLFENEKIEFYSLQVNPSMNNYKEYKLTDLGSTFKDFDDTAGALKNLDVVITVDTSVAHLAGALGVKTFMLLPYVMDWRWFDNDEKTEWYDSVAIFKQKNPKYWDDVIAVIKNNLTS